MLALCFARFHRKKTTKKTDIVTMESAGERGLHHAARYSVLIGVLSAFVTLGGLAVSKLGL